MAIEDAYQLAKDLTKATQSFRQPYYKLEETLVVSATSFCTLLLNNSGYTLAEV